MKKSRHNRTHASAVQITLALLLVSISTLLIASSFASGLVSKSPPIVLAALNLPVQEPEIPEVTCGAGNIRVEATNAGSNANYATLQAAFAAINSGTHTGSINIGACANTTETLSAVLNASATGSASYSSVNLTPTGARTISGAIAAGSPLIDLNGAKNVTINGLNSGGNSLTLSNTTSANNANTSTIRFINGAQNNMVTNCAVLGSSVTASITAGGTILFSTSTAPGGNSNNTISNNAIGPAGANLPSKGIMGLGTAAPNDNILNLIDNNNIVDFFSPTLDSVGISILGNNATWTISNNRLYQTAPRAFMGNLLYAGVSITSNGNAFTITGNTIGFGAPNGTGTTAISGFGNNFRGLNLTATNTTTATSVQGNKISGISQNTSSTGTGIGSAFIGIYLAAGRYDVGTVTGNTIGSLDGSSAIVFTGSGASPQVSPIYDHSSSSNTISNNSIGAIAINGTGTGTGFTGITSNTAPIATITLNNNMIGGSGAGAITNSQGGSCQMYGIQSLLGSVTVTGNTIRNISNSAPSAFISGIYLTGSTSGINTVSRNVVHSLSNPSGTSVSYIYAIYCDFPATANLVDRNLIHSLSITSPSLSPPVLTGLFLAAGNGTFKNNMIRLGLNASGAALVNDLSIYGIYEINGATRNLYFNSVYIGGTGVVSAGTNTFALYALLNVVTRNYLGNIFWNARSNASGSGHHFALTLNGQTGVTSNHNDLYASGTGGAVGSSGGNQVTLADWQAATGLDSASISADPQFIDPNGTARPGNAPDAIDGIVNLHLTATSPCLQAAAPASGATTDFDGDLRSLSTPDIGADEVIPLSGASLSMTKTADASSVSYPSQVGFTVKLSNNGPDPAANLSFTDNLPSAPGVSWSIDPANTNAGWSVAGGPPSQSLVLSPTLSGMTMTQAHVVSNTTSATCGATLNNTASFTSSNGGNGSAMASESVVNSSSTLIFTEYFDGVVHPSLPAGWVASNAVNPDAIFWTTSNGGSPVPVADTLPNAAYINDPGVVSDKRLDSPSIGITTAAAQLTFRNNYDLDTASNAGFDGGVLEISISGGAFADIIAAGGNFVTGGYNSILAGGANPIAGRQAWSGNSGGFITTTVNLPPAAAGQAIRLRWRMGSDDSDSRSGWRIDSISIVDFICPAPTATPIPTPSPTPTATPTPALSISGVVQQCAGATSNPLANVTVTLTGSASGTTLSDPSGNYTLGSLTSGGNYTVTPTKAARVPASAGINTTDVLAAQRHFLAITLLTGCRLTAADVNASGGVNTSDVIAIQRFFLGLTTGTANVGKYGFTPATYSYSPLTSNQTAQNFDTIVFGDCASPFANP